MPAGTSWSWSLETVFWNPTPGPVLMYLGAAPPLLWPVLWMVGGKKGACCHLSGGGGFAGRQGAAGCSPSPGSAP